MKTNTKHALLIVTVATLAAGAASVLGPAVAAAHPDRAADRRELRQDRREQRDDLRDLALLQALTRRYESAVATRDRAALRAIDRQVAAMLEAEFRETHHELRRAGREARGERFELREDRRGHEGPLAYLGDRRDLRDDRRDAAREASRLRRLARIREAWHEASLCGPRREIALKRVLLRELCDLARAELRDDRGR